MDYRALLLEGNVQPFLWKARYGIERESQRVTEAGQLVATEQPNVSSIYSNGFRRNTSGVDYTCMSVDPRVISVFSCYP